MLKILFPRAYANIYEETLERNLASLCRWAKDFAQKDESLSRPKTLNHAGSYGWQAQASLTAQVHRRSTIKIK